MYITKADFNTHIYAELITAIGRDDDTIINAAIAAAISEAKGYLSRYNVAELLSAEDAERDPVLVMYIKDIASWHFISLANANVDLELRKTRYEDAIRWLKNIQAGKVVYQDWPIPTVDNKGDNDIWQIGSQPKRETRY
ncbi:phage protein Gp36 family protein [Cellulophaga lytica]|uniref:phage protein Gp36 family protein n=1 Tax=Cellulophaga lytica TaxID=979 RepID=UPI003CE55B29